jgi:hypothetical protein
MATVNIGNIKLNWKGAYNAGTAYVIDDVVSYNGSSYVCIAATTGNLPTVTAKWNQMSAAGTDGTDLTSTLTTQGDILYRDGSGLQRLGAGTSGQLLKTQGTGANPIWATVDSGKIKQTHWQWDDQQASVPQTSSGSGTGLDIFNYSFTAQSDNPHFVLDLSIYVGRNQTGNDQGDVYVVAWIHDTSGGTIRYPFGFYKGANYRCNSAFRALTGNYFLEDTDAGQYSDTNNWGGMRYSYPAVMGNQSSADTTPNASSGISAGQGLTLSIHLGGSGDTWYNRTHSQTNSMSRSWFRLTELDGTL